MLGVGNRETQVTYLWRMNVCVCVCVLLLLLLKSVRSASCGMYVQGGR